MTNLLAYASRSFPVIAAVVSALGSLSAGCSAVAEDDSVDVGDNAAALTSTSWKMFDNISFRTDPNLSCVLSEDLMFISTGGLFAAGTNIQNAPGADASELHARATEIAERKPLYVILDIEAWRGPLPDRALRDYDANRYAKTIDELRSLVRQKGNTRTRFAYYGAPFMERAFSARTAAAHTLANAQDALAPSLYPASYSMFSNPDEWVSHAKKVLADARAVAPGKPILAYLRPQLSEGAPGTVEYAHWRELVPGKLWTTMLETTHREATSAIFWGVLDPASHDHVRAPWNPHAAWWLATKTFAAQELHVSISSCP